MGEGGDGRRSGRRGIWGVVRFEIAGMMLNAICHVQEYSEIEADETET